LRGARQRFAIREDIVLGIKAAPQAYPFDWYYAKVSVRLRARSKTTNKLASLPTELATDVRGLAAYSIDFTDERDHPTVAVIAERKFTTKLFVVSVAFIPVLFLVIVLYELATFRPTGNKESRRAFQVEAAVGILAILPLRQVLVPTDISRLTVVDYFFGSLALAFALAVCFRVVIDVAARRRCRSPEARAGPTS
jgi:hypothetical protein